MNLLYELKGLLIAPNSFLIDIYSIKVNNSINMFYCYCTIWFIFNKQYENIPTVTCRLFKSWLLQSVVVIPSTPPGCRTLRGLLGLRHLPPYCDHPGTAQIHCLSFSNYFLKVKFGS